MNNNNYKIKLDLKDFEVEDIVKKSFAIAELSIHLMNNNMIDLDKANELGVLDKEEELIILYLNGSLLINGDYIPLMVEDCFYDNICLLSDLSGLDFDVIYDFVWDCYDNIDLSDYLGLDDPIANDDDGVDSDTPITDDSDDSDNNDDKK